MKRIWKYFAKLIAKGRPRSLSTLRHWKKLKNWEKPKKTPTGKQIEILIGTD